MILSRWPYILTGCLVFVLLLLGLCIWKCCCRKKGAKKAPKGQKILPFTTNDASPSDAYLPLKEQGHSPNGKYQGSMNGDYDNAKASYPPSMNGDYPTSPAPVYQAAPHISPHDDYHHPPLSPHHSPNNYPYAPSSPTSPHSGYHNQDGGPFAANGQGYNQQYR